MEESLVIRVSILELYVLNPFNNRNITLSSRWWILLSLFLWQPSSELCVPFFCSIVDLWKKTDNRRTSLSLLSALALDFASWHLSDWVRFNRHEVCIVPRSFCTFESSHFREFSRSSSAYRSTFPAVIRVLPYHCYFRTTLRTASHSQLVVGSHVP